MLATTDDEDEPYVAMKTMLSGLYGRGRRCARRFAKLYVSDESASDCRSSRTTQGPWRMCWMRLVRSARASRREDLSVLDMRLPASVSI